MAAPMDVFESEEEEENDEEIDVLSPNFNPLKALYASNVTLPVDDASVFNNLAEYERFMSKTEETGAQTQEQKSTAAPMSRRALERLHLQHMKEKEKELPRSTHHLKKMYQLNVLSRMEREQTMESPLDLLRQCVEKRCKIRVCIRSFKGLRSICIGYLVAFDKIWNMALSDVVEIYKRPSTGKRFHHEEKVTYSMIMSNLNPRPKKPDPPKTSEPKGIVKKRAKECKFCRIKHETLMEQEAEAVQRSRDAESSLSWSETESSDSETDDYSTTEESTISDVEKEIGKMKSEKDRRKEKTPKKKSGLCPNGHERPITTSRRSVESFKPDDSKSRREDLSDAKVPVGSTSKTSTSSVEPKKTLESSEPLQNTASSLNPKSANTAEVSTKKSSSSSKSLTLSTSRKSDLLLSRMTSQTKQESVSTAGGTTLSAHSRSSITTASSSLTTQSSSSSLSQAFSKSLTIGKKSRNVSDTKSQDEKKRETEKEVVHLDPKTGKRLIQPEEFKRRHVNQLFIRGDQVVLVSVDSEMVEVDVKKTSTDKSDET